MVVAGDAQLRVIDDVGGDHEDLASAADNEKHGGLDAEIMYDDDEVLNALQNQVQPPQQIWFCAKVSDSGIKKILEIMLPKESCQRDHASGPAK
jgi:hypothetical protein